MRFVASVVVAVLAVSAVAGQSIGPAQRIVSAGARGFVGFETLATEAGAADVVFIHELAGGAGMQRLEMAVLQTLAANPARRADVMFAVDVINHAAQEPLEHFQMGHLSERELATEARMPAAHVQTYMPLIKFAVDQAWPIVATGSASDSAASATIVQAVMMGETMGKRRLVVSLHTAAPVAGVKTAALVRHQLAGRRVLSLGLVPTSSLDSTISATDVPAGIDYLAYAR